MFSRTPDTMALSATMCDVIQGRKFNTAGNILEIKVAVHSRYHYSMFPFEFSIRSTRYVRHCSSQTFCTFDDVRITRWWMANWK
jgi:hypothetical protein